MAPYKILKQGYMEKEPPLSKRGLRKKLLRYWFVLVEDKKQVALVYFRNEDQYIARQRNDGFIRVDESESISVVGDYMGRKHAFVIKTSKGEYTLAPESRYDLHEWLFTLHNSLEVFKKRQEKTRQRQAMRPRSNTVDSSNSRAQQGASGGGQRTPPHTPIRRAPPPPVQRRRPHRPAPEPPSSTGEPAAEYPLVEDETPPPGYSVSDSVAMSHDLTDLDISLVDHDVQENGNEEGRYPLNEPNDLVLETRSNLMHQTSSSMPDLLTHDGEDTPTTSPEEERTNELGHEGNSPQENHLHTRHTRHHSLTITEIKAKKKRSSRRQGSLKVRSRSPPEMPPPPPPEGGIPTSPTLLEEPTNGLAAEGLDVMDVLDDIEHQIDEISDEFSPKPSVPAPVRGCTFTPERSTSPGHDTTDGFDENEWLCDVPLNHTPFSHAPLRTEVRQGILASPENAETETIPPTLHHGGQHRKGKQVMFKEQVEDIIPITYEPVADGNYDSADSSDNDQIIPSSVAELKKRLFGDREGEAARYKREGPLSPSHTHPLNANFDVGYSFEGQSSAENPPNINNNNSGGDASNHDNETNLYDHPWESKSVTTFKLPPKTTPLPQVTTPIHHETTPPPPVAPKPVSPPTVTEDSVASAWSQRSPLAIDNDSLLSSISCTLQETSKYGSDSLLNSSSYEAIKKKNEVRFSSKGELEKIRAEHRRDPPPPPQTGDSPSPQGNSPQAMKRKWPNGQRPFAGPPKTAASLDTLSEPKPNTRVTYDANTNSHIYRSLV